MQNNNFDRDQYFKDGKTWEQEVYANIRASRNRAWFVAFGSMGLALLSLTALLCLMPLKTVEPFVVTVDRATGYMEMAQGLYKGNLTEDEAIAQSNLVRYVSLRESYNPSILRENYEQVSLMSQGKALQEYQHLWDGENPENPSKILGRRSSMEVKVQAISFVTDNIASVRYVQELYEDSKVKKSYWTAIVGFQYVQKPEKMADRFNNPLGFQVTSYRKNPETMESVQ